MTASADSEIDYLAVGHVTVDVICDAPGGQRRQPGGGAFYSALQAARLGLRAAILTAGAPEELEQLLAPYRDELSVLVLGTDATTTLATSGSGEARRQRLLAWAGPLPAALEAPRPALVLHLAPVARELQGDGGLDAPFVGLTPQGLVRSWDEQGGEIQPAVADAGAAPRRLDAAVLSAAELASCEPLLHGERTSQAPILAVTAGGEATSVRLRDGSTEHVTPPRPQAVLDDLGAGDVFAAAFFVALARGSAATEAAAFGNAAAVVRIAGIGPDAVGRRSEIEALAGADGA